MPTLGVVIPAFNSADVILDCLESLIATHDVQLDIVVPDNASTDGTVQLLCDWAAGRHAYSPPDDLPFKQTPVEKPLLPSIEKTTWTTARGHRIRLIETGINGGFAAAVNVGLAWLAAQPQLDRFWILNPDSAVPPGTAYAFATQAAPEGGFSLMGGRVVYLERPDQIQMDGGLIDWRTGVTHNANQNKSPNTTPVPDPATFDFISGASMVASRQFYEQAGPLVEDYFLYYEEVDWALRRGALPLAYCAQGLVYHRAGTAIGSPAPGRPATPFALYFRFRNRIWFIRHFRPSSLPLAFAFSVAKACQLLIQRAPLEAWTVLTASIGRPPSRDIRARLTPDAADMAFPTQRPSLTSKTGGQS